jgi:hypothetical protein
MSPYRHPIERYERALAEFPVVVHRSWLERHRERISTGLFLAIIVGTVLVVLYVVWP